MSKLQGSLLQRSSGKFFRIMQGFGLKMREKQLQLFGKFLELVFMHKLPFVAETFIRADFWEGDATKHFSSEKKGFSVKRGEAIQ